MQQTRAFGIIICSRALIWTWEHLRVAEENGIYLDTYRFESLDYFFTLTERIKIQDLA